MKVPVADPTGFIGCLRLNHLISPFDNPAIRRVVLQLIVSGEEVDTSFRR